MKRGKSILIAVIITLIFALCVFGCAKTPNAPDNSGPSTGITDTDGTNNNTDNGTTDSDNNENNDNTDKPDNTDDPDNGDSEDNSGGTPKNTVTTVYYTNSKNWTDVYAYLWKYSTGARKAEWPGEKLAVSGTSGFGEKQYSVKVDYSVYDRIIFNDGGSNKTKDLVVSGATSGYYGEDGIFTMGTENYGRVTYTTLTDTKNLNYISSSRKKISVYTPSGYTTSKKYGVLYMFDSQNLYAAADGLDSSQNTKNSWAADVAVTNLVKNGGNGVIIVAVDNTDGHRDAELTMSPSFGNVTSLAYNDDFRNGKLEKLGDFIKETLMPWVKNNYSVDTRREMTGICGSSSGGLAAYYLGLRDNDLYGYIGALSPANGLFEQTDWARFYNSKNFDAGKPKVYVYCGKGTPDEDELLPAAKRIKDLTNYGISVTENYVDNATHSENYWRIAFCEFLGLMAQ